MPAITISLAAVSIWARDGSYLCHNAGVVLAHVGHSAHVGLQAHSLLRMDAISEQSYFG
jgi:hypothetical protein